MSATIIGMRAVLASAREATKNARGALGAAIYQEGLAVMAQSIREVPVDDSVLKNSHYVTPPNETFMGPVVELGYGTKYAVYQHEITDLRHTVGKAKYLEDPLNKALGGYAGRVAERAASNLQKGVTKVGTGGTPTRPKEA